MSASKTISALPTVADLSTVSQVLCLDQSKKLVLVNVGAVRGEFGRVSDCDDATKNGSYGVNSGCLNAPCAVNTSDRIHVYLGAGFNQNYFIQIYMSYIGANEMYVRTYVMGKGYTEWRQFA